MKTGSVACPPAGEGRSYCVLQHAYAPAGIKLAAAVLAVWLLSELLFVRLPALRVRWSEGERLVRRQDGHGHAAVVADPILTAANWGIVPEHKTAWRVVKPEPNRAADVIAAPVAEETAEERVRWPGPVDPTGPGVVPAATPPAVDGVHALNAAERIARATGRHGRHIRVLTAEEARGRRLRRGSDPALVVSCWSDASSARALPDAVRNGVSA